jgi:hypothetical protein
LQAAEGDLCISTMVTYPTHKTLLSIKFKMSGTVSFYLSCCIFILLYIYDFTEGIWFCFLLSN